MSTAGEEVRDPQRALPRAIMGALVIVVTVYVLVALAGVGAQPVEEFEDPEQQSAGLSVILENITGSSVPATILAAGAVISIFSVTLVTLYGQTRILFAMGRDGMLPDRFASVNPRTLTPTFNTIVVGDRGRADRWLRPGRLPVGHRVDRHPDGVHRGRHRRARAAPYASPSWSDRSGCPGYPVTPLLTIGGVHLHPLRAGRGDLGDLRCLADGRAGVLPALGTPARDARTAIAADATTSAEATEMTLVVGYTPHKGDTLPDPSSALRSPAPPGRTCSS